MNSLEYQIDKTEISRRFRFLSSDTLIFDYQFILVKDKELQIGDSYIKIENWLIGSNPRPICLLDVWENDGIACFKIRDYISESIEILTYNLSYYGDFWLWSLTDLDYIFNMPE